MPQASSASTPRIVVPPGEHTPSLISPGCMPVSSWSRPVPTAVWLARRYAVARGRPCFTPASAIASIIIATNAGPQPEIAIAAPISREGSVSTAPSALNSFTASSRSEAVSVVSSSNSSMPAPTPQGVFGMMYCTRTDSSTSGLYRAQV